MDRQSRHTARTSLLLAFCASALLAASPSGEQRLVISVHDGRPMAEAVRVIEERYGWTITYEDPPYVHPDDAVDVTERVRRTPAPGNRRVLVPRGGTFEVGYPQPPGGGQPDPDALLQHVVEEYNSTGLTGRFRVEQRGGAFHVVPSHYKAATGKLEPYRSALDTKVSPGAKEQSAYEMMMAIVGGVTAAGAIKLGPGTFPMNAFLQRRVSGTAGEETARDALLRLLRETGLRLTWKLYCGPGAPPQCALNFTAVPPRSVRRIAGHGAAAGDRRVVLVRARSPRGD